jgi:hypothetical protein
MVSLLLLGDEKGKVSRPPLSLPDGARTAGTGAVRELQACVLRMAASSTSLSPPGKHFKGSCCPQKTTRTLKACASLCPVAGRSQTPCVWALSSPQRASCERACPPRRTPAGPRRCLWERWGRRRAGILWPGLWCLLCCPHTPPVVFLPCK